MELIGSYWIKLDHIGSNWIKLDQIVSNWHGLDKPGHRTWSRQTWTWKTWSWHGLHLILKQSTRGFRFDSQSCLKQTLLHLIWANICTSNLMVSNLNSIFFLSIQSWTHPKEFKQEWNFYNGTHICQPVS